MYSMLYDRVDRLVEAPHLHVGIKMAAVTNELLHVS